MSLDDTNSLVDAVHQSPPVDTSAPYDVASLAGKTILITGGASGFGAAFARKWAQHGAHIALGDINDTAGEELIAELRATTPGGEHHHYQHCDVTSWDSQVAFFRAAVERSATKSIDAVVPNAGIADYNSPANGRGFENPVPLSESSNDGSLPADPKPPKLAVAAVNITGVLYSVHLAMYWLPRNTKGQPKVPSSADRHILLISSVAGLFGLPGQALYTTSKHAVTGLFRALRGTAYLHGVRVNMLCPYFVDTNIMPTSGMGLLAGGGAGTVEDVVDAGTRFMADGSLAGRALVIGPRLKLAEGSEQGAPLGLPDSSQVLGPADKGVKPGASKAIWECYAHDYDNSELFVLRYIRLLNGLARVRGWTGYIRDVVGILFSGRQQGRVKNK